MGQLRSNFGCGLLRGAVALTVNGALLSAYSALHGLGGLLELDESAVCTWVIAFVGYDFVYYWVHRLSHRLPWLWAGHAVHHQPTEMGMSVLLRAGAIVPLQVFPFYATLALLGVPTPVYASVAFGVHASMLWLHPTSARPLPVLGWILNTPAAHHVHHGAQLERANFGGVLMVWDRMFGTYGPPVGDSLRFGIALPGGGIASTPRCPFEANFVPLRDLARSLDFSGLVTREAKDPENCRSAAPSSHEHCPPRGGSLPP